MAAIGALGFLAYRRRGGLAGTIISTLTIALLVGAVVSTVLATAATASCASDPPSPGGVLAAQSSTPFTGADIPWIIAGVLVVSGAAVIAFSPKRPRRSHKS